MTLCALLLVFVAGCEATTTLHGARQTPAHYLPAGRLETQLPARLPVSATMAAGKAALLGRGYVIVRESATDEYGLIVGKTPALGMRRHVTRTVTVKSWRAAAGPEVVVEFGPLPDEIETKAVLDDMLALLDL